MLLYRVLTAIVGIPVVLLAIWLGGWALATLLFLISILGLREFYGLARQLGAKPAAWAGYPFAVLFIVTAIRPELALLVLTLLMLSAFVSQLFRPSDQPFLISVSSGILGCLYIP